MRYAPGVVPESQGTTSLFWNASSLQLRGFIPDIYQDGLTDDAYGNTLLDTYFYQRVEVLEGPSSVLYGQGNPAGIVNFETKRHEPARVAAWLRHLWTVRRQLRFQRPAGNAPSSLPAYWSRILRRRADVFCPSGALCDRSGFDLAAGFQDQLDIVKQLHLQPRGWRSRHCACPLETISFAWLLRSAGATGIAVLLQLRCAVQIPERKGALQARHGRSSYTKLSAFGGNQYRNGCAGVLG